MGLKPACFEEALLARKKKIISVQEKRSFIFSGERKFIADNAPHLPSWL